MRKQLPVTRGTKVGESTKALTSIVAKSPAPASSPAKAKPKLGSLLPKTTIPAPLPSPSPAPSRYRFKDWETRAINEALLSGLSPAEIANSRDKEEFKLGHLTFDQVAKKAARLGKTLYDNTGMSFLFLDIY